jgi:hypothetical protein
MLGWLGVAMTEPMAGGKGPIGQIAWWLHLPTFQAYYQAAGVLLVVLPIIFGALAYVNKRPGQVGYHMGPHATHTAQCCWQNRLVVS